MPRIKGVGEIDWDFDKNISPVRAPYDGCRDYILYGTVIRLPAPLAVNPTYSPTYSHEILDIGFIPRAPRSLWERSAWRLPPERWNELRYISPLMRGMLCGFLRDGWQSIRGCTAYFWEHKPNQIAVAFYTASKEPVRHPTIFITALARKLSEAAREFREQETKKEQNVRAPYRLESLDRTLNRIIRQTLK